ncbi:MAG: amidohydrolase [Gaiellales bacterium]
MILEGGTIHTGDPALPRVQALPIDDRGRVTRGVEAWEGDASAVSNERVDLGGRTVVPGFVDAHIHFLSWALDRARVDVRDAPTGAAVLEHVAARAADERATGLDGTWLIGSGWTEQHLAEFGGPAAESNGPAADSTDPAAALEAATGGRPAALWSRDRHALWLNRAALEQIGGEAVRREDAAWATPLPEPTRAERQRAVVEGQQAAHALGLTGIHDFERRLGRRTWQELDVQERVTLRVASSIPAEHLDAIDAVEAVAGFGSAHVRTGPVKAFLDGTVGARTAHMLEPYDDGGTGMALLSTDQAAEAIRRAAGLGLPIAMHAIGDAAVRSALDALERTRADWEDLAQSHGLPPRIEHAQLVHPDDLARFAELGVVASMQPVHAGEDRAAAEAAWGARCAGAYAWRPLLETGAALVFGTDAPISPIDPIATLAAAVGDPLRPEHAITVADALTAMTVTPSAILGLDRRVGRLAPGHLADLVVLDRDPFATPVDELSAIEVVATMVGGRWVHGRPPW